ncbi:MAG: hypothetical protein JXL67_01200 [Calditrichaeota bacterium]|nr:hypothetical protein [Calditrichota bacterium]
MSFDIDVRIEGHAVPRGKYSSLIGKREKCDGPGLGLHN